MTDHPDPTSAERPEVVGVAAAEARAAAAAEVEHGEIVPAGDEEELQDSVTSPAKVMRIGSMVKALLEEVRGAQLDEPSRERLAEIYERSVVELSEALSPDLQQELKMLTLPFKDGEVPSESEIRVAKAQLVGWLEGLFHGIQATLFAQQLAARQQLEQMRQLPPATPASPAARAAPDAAPERPSRHISLAFPGHAGRGWPLARWRLAPFIAFPGHAAHGWPLARWRSHRSWRSPATQAAGPLARWRSHRSLRSPATQAAVAARSLALARSHVGRDRPRRPSRSPARSHGPLARSRLASRAAELPGRGPGGAAVARLRARSLACRDAAHQGGADRVQSAGCRSAARSFRRRRQVTFRSGDDRRRSRSVCSRC